MKYNKLNSKEVQSVFSDFQKECMEKYEMDLKDYWNNSWGFQVIDFGYDFQKKFFTTDWVEMEKLQDEEVEFSCRFIRAIRKVQFPIEK